MSNIRVRIAPSPTGPLHIGTARTALFNYLFAKHTGGKFILRIEDTDLGRSDKKYEKDILNGLIWLGIKTDEDPLKNGPYKSYRQSERLEIYKGYLEKLLKEGNAFYCFHSEEELNKERNQLMQEKHAPIHACEFRNLSTKEAETLKETKPNSIIRFKTPLGRKISFLDMVRGEINFESDLIGDFSIAKKLDVPLYNFAVVVDDFEMQISHVIRGEDHIANTPKQMLLIEALSLSQPQYAHLPLILGPDRSKLSKRNAVTSVEEYRNLGYLPEALFNFMTLLGWNSGKEKEIFSKDELIKNFSIERIQKSGAIFDITKLDWMNGEYIRNLNPQELLDRAKPFFPKNKKSASYLLGVLKIEQPRLKRFSELNEKTDYFFNVPVYNKKLLRWKKTDESNTVSSLKKSLELLEKNKEKNIQDIENIFMEEAQKTGDRGVMLWPLRVALSGKKASPGPFEIIDVIGIEEAIKRLKNAKNLF